MTEPGGGDHRRETRRSRLLRVAARIVGSQLPDGIAFGLAGARLVRIAYGVHGYGRGHATRALAVLPELSRRHKLLVLAGGEAYQVLWPDIPVVRIPTLGYYYGRRGKRSNLLTVRRNAPAVLDLLLRGPAFQSVLETLDDFRPELVISDAEAWTHRAARRLGIPRIGFDHFGILAHCRLSMSWRDRLLSRRDVCVYRALMGCPQRVIVSSFYDAAPRHAGVRVVGALLRPAVLAARPSWGPHVLVYLNNGPHQFNDRLEQAFRQLDCPVVVYGTQRQGASGRLDFRPPSDLPFIEHLASCRAVLSTAGNQLVAEALQLGKPILVMPEDCVEQRLNAAAVERLGVGMRVGLTSMSAERICEFLRGERDYRQRVRQVARDGRREALEAIEQFAAELTDSNRATMRRRPVVS